MNYYTLTSEKSIEKLQSDLTKGLTYTEASNRLKQYGKNILPQEKPISVWQILISQVFDPLMIILIVAASLTYLINEKNDFFVILFIILFELIISFIEEYRSEQTLSKLVKISRTKTKVIREGNLLHLDSELLVPGDIIQIDGGDKIPADCRLVETEYLLSNESILTGESNPVEKNTDTIQTDTPISDQRNMIFQGTFIVHGSALAIVISTGKNTEFGHIASSVLMLKKPQTPLQKKLNNFSRLIAIVILVLALIFTVIGVSLGKNIYDVILLAISISVSAIPESFPIIVMIALVIGVARLARKKVIVRHLPAVETLGSTSVIGIDKTGTITENKLSVRKIVLADGKNFVIDSQDYSPQGNFLFDGHEIKPIDYPDLELFLIAGAVCNDSSIQKNSRGEWIAVGDPTESALIAAAAKAELDPESMKTDYPREETIPFHFGQNYMVTLNHCLPKNIRYIFIKGSPETILEYCSYRLMGDKVVKLSSKDKQDILETCKNLAQKSYRLLAVAYKEAPGQGNVTLDATSLKYGIIFNGIAAMTDPIRHSASSSFALAKKAGLDILIITGDHPSTALNVAKAIGLKITEENILTGDRLLAMSDQEFNNIADKIQIYARVLPEQKLRIIDYWQTKGQIVGMTGDGINDAPALKKADIGIAMGNGTEVAKEAAEIVLIDNDFSRIVTMIQQGRLIYDNIKKTVIYLLGHNLGEVGTIIVALLLNLPLPMIPLQILWTNFITDGLVDESLVFEPAEPGIMSRPPRSASEKFISSGMTRRIVVMGVYITLVSLLIFKYFLDNQNIFYARSVVFTLMSFFAFFGVYANRGLNTSSFKLKFFHNQFFIYAVFISFIMQMCVLYLPFFNNIFDTRPLSGYDLIFVTVISASLLFVIELEKYFSHFLSKNKELA